MVSPVYWGFWPGLPPAQGSVGCGVGQGFVGQGSVGHSVGQVVGVVQGVVQGV